MNKKIVLGVGALLIIGLLVWLGVSFNQIKRVEIVNPIKVETNANAEIGRSMSSANWELNNGEVVYHLGGSFINSSTTIVSAPDPFLMATTSESDVVISGSYPNGYTGASSTVEVLKLNVTGVATSTFTVACGASAKSGYNGAVSNAYTIISSDSVATSSTATIENNITSSYGTQVGGGSVAKIMLGPTYPYLVCVVTTAYSGAFTETTNTFDGKWVARVTKVQ